MESRLGYVELYLSDHPMDLKGPYRLRLNALPEKCICCSFPDLDHVPLP
jgi:hypothetical protein